MFILDSLMISGIQWALKTVLTAAEAELNDDGALRDRLLEAEMRRETGEISDEEFVEIERDLLRAIREIKERREGGSGAFVLGGAQPLESGDETRFAVEAEIAGEFYGASESATPAPAADAAPLPVAHHTAARGTPRVPRNPRTPRAVRARRTTRTTRRK